MSSIHIEEIGGACPVQAYGIIDDAYRLYFRARGGRWQFVAGPAEIETDSLVEQVLLVQGYDQGVERDERIFALQGDNAQEGYLSDEDSTYSVARGLIDVCVQQFRAWLRYTARCFCGTIDHFGNKRCAHCGNYFCYDHYDQHQSTYEVQS